MHTAWAILALIAADWHQIDTRPVENGVSYLMSKQLDSGDWPQEQITGVFNRNCMISYSNYRQELETETSADWYYFDCRYWSLPKGTEFRAYWWSG